VSTLNRDNTSSSFRTIEEPHRITTNEQPGAPKYEITKQNLKISKASLLKQKMIKNPFLGKQSRNQSSSGIQAHPPQTTKHQTYKTLANQVHD